MKRLVVLEIDGNSEDTQFRVSLEIKADLQTIQKKGVLTKHAHLFSCLGDHWQTAYRNLEANYRIRPLIIDNTPSLKERIRNCQESAIALEKLMAEWLNSEEFLPLDRRLREELNRDDEICFVIRTENNELQKLPWHTWDFFDRYPKAELAFASLERESTVTKSRSFHPKVRILAILGHSGGIDVERDRQLLENLPGAEVHFLVEPHHFEINNTLWEKPWDIIFFAGHSETLGETGRIYLNSEDYLSIEELWFALRKAVDNGLQLAIFNSCDGLGLARRLDDLNIPQTIVMRELAPDRVAHEFLKYFLTAFAIEEKPFHRAVREARERLQGLESELPCASWLPVIYQDPNAEPLTWKPKSPGVLSKFPVSMTAIAAAVVSGYFLSTPYLAKLLNQWGIESYENGNAHRAEMLYNLSTQLNPFASEPYYNRGWFYEFKLGDRSQAKYSYQKAVLRDSQVAVVAWTRLLLLDDPTPDTLQMALTAIEEGLDLVNEDYSLVKAGLLKNRGWIFFLGDRLDEAKQSLQEVLAINDRGAHTHCLMAQILEKQGNFNDADRHWSKVIDNADIRYPEHNQCLELAHLKQQTWTTSEVQQ